MATAPQAAASGKEKSGPSMTPVVVAAVLGLVTVVLTNIYITQVKKQVEGESFIVYRLRASVEPGDKIKRNDLVEVRVPAQFQDTFSNRIDPEGLDAWLPKPVKRAAGQNDILTFDLYSPPYGQAIDTEIPEGKGWVALPLDNRKVTGLLRPGMYVDVTGTITLPGQLPETIVVIERVKVVAIGSRTEEDYATGRSSSFRNVTVQVPIDDAIALEESRHLLDKDEFGVIVRRPNDLTNLKIPGGGVNPRLEEMAQPRRR